MEDFSIESKSYPGKLERVSQDKCARTLTNCYTYSTPALIGDELWNRKLRIYL